MEYRTLGRTGLLVSEISLGTQTFGGSGFWARFGTLGQSEVDRIVSRSLDAGVNCFDTAEAYSEGESERLLGRALGARRTEVVIATKVTGRFGPGLNQVGLSSRRVLEAIEGSLRRLQTDYVDLYQIHSPDPLTGFEETLRALEDVVRAGKARYIGCSNLHAWELMKALAVSQRRGWTRFDSLQAYYSIAGRDLEREVIPLLVDQQVGLLVWSPLAGGFLTDKCAAGRVPPEARRATLAFPPLDEERALRCLGALREIAGARGITVARVALAWLLGRPAVTSVIIGVRNEEQLSDDLRAAEVVLSEDDLARLEEVSAPAREYPRWMLDLAAEGREVDPLTRRGRARQKPGA